MKRRSGRTTNGCFPGLAWLVYLQEENRGTKKVIKGCVGGIHHCHFFQGRKKVSLDEKTISQSRETNSNDITRKSFVFVNAFKKYFFVICVRFDRSWQENQKSSQDHQYLSMIQSPLIFPTD